MIRRSLRKIEPFRPKEFARNAQEQFVMANEAIKKWVVHYYDVWLLTVRVYSQKGQVFIEKVDHWKRVWGKSIMCVGKSSVLVKE